MGKSLWMYSSYSWMQHGNGVFPNLEIIGDFVSTPDLQENDALHVIDGTLWYSEASSCLPDGCSLFPNGGPYSTPIPGTEDIPFDEYWTLTTQPPSGDYGRPDGATNAGIYDNCSDPSSWNTQKAGTTVTIYATSAGTFPPDFVDTPNRMSGAYFTADYSGTQAQFLNAIFGAAVNPNNTSLLMYNSWVAHVVFENERTGDQYHIIFYADDCE